MSYMYIYVQKNVHICTVYICTFFGVYIYVHKFYVGMSKKGIDGCTYMCIFARIQTALYKVRLYEPKSPYWWVTSYFQKPYYFFKHQRIERHAVDLCIHKPYQKILNNVYNHPNTGYVIKINFWLNKKYKRVPKIY